MIDFRYHLVSLMAVLIALTIGVILGAGPLQGPLSSTLTGQVDRLTEQQHQLTRDNQQLQGQTQADAKYIDALGTRAVSHSLQDVPVCLVRTAQTQGADADRVSKRLTQAGAKVALQIQLSDSWLSTKDADARAAVANRAAGYLTPEQKSDSAETMLDNTLLAAATTATPNTKVLRDLLAAGDHPLASFSNPDVVCQALVVMTGTVTGKQALSPDAVGALGQALGGNAGGAVVVGDAAGEGQVVGLLRQNSVAVATVDSISTAKAAITTPLALAQARNGKKDAYGVQSGASLIAPGAGD